MCWLAKLQFYKSLVVPVLEYTSPVWSAFTQKDTQKLEYASPVWSAFTQKDTQKLDLVQRHVTKAILGYQHMDYESRLRLLELVSLEERRRVKDLVTCYKYINGFIDVDTRHFSPAHCLRTRSSHDQKLQIQFCQTKGFKFFIF